MTYGISAEDLKEEIEETKKIFKVESTDTALLILIYQTLDQIRFHNTE